MNKTALKNFAVWARVELIRHVTDRANEYGVTEALCKKNAVKFSVDFVRPEGGLLSGEEAALRDALLRTVGEKGFSQVMEEAAYTWFNRFIALKYLEVHGLSPLEESILPRADGLPPRILSVAQWVELPGVDRRAVLKMLEANETEALYKHLVIALCNALNEPLPHLFEPIQDYTELLFPRGLLRSDSVLCEMARKVDPKDWQKIEIIGWLYQYYNTELKDETFALLKKNVKINKERIGAATQLFTPEWIVRYMVENALGRLWLERERAITGKGEKELAASFGWKYYLPEAEQEPEVEAKLQELRATRRNLSPEGIHLIDPCMGSGHILACAFDVFVQIYRASGYTDLDAVKNIVEKNLYGLDIDDRAAQLAYFTVMMKACEIDPRFLARGLQPNVLAIQESNSLEAFDHLSSQMDLGMTDVNLANELIEAFRDAKEYGSILDVSLSNLDALPDLMTRLEESGLTDLELNKWLKSARSLLSVLAAQASIMARKYEAVITNPPYMGGSGMGAKLSERVKATYPDSKSDMSTVFMEKALKLCDDHGMISMINIPVWMFLSSYAKLRINTISQNTYVNMVHFGRGIFGSDFGTTSFVIGKQHISNYKGSYRRLFEKQGAVDTNEQKEQWFLEGMGRYIVQQENFAKIPGSPIVYWLSKPLSDLFVNAKLIGGIASPKQGSTLGNNEQFLRIWFEIGSKNTRWFNCMKGGEYRKWYGNVLHVIDWEDNGKRVKATGRATIRSEMFLFRKGITWSNITSGKSTFRYMHDGFFFESTGSVCFVEDEFLYYILGFLNTPIAETINAAINPTIHLQSGDVSKLPLVVNQNHLIGINKYVAECIHIAKLDWDSIEVSWDFATHPMLVFRMPYRFYGENRKVQYDLGDSFECWKQNMEVRFRLLKQNEEELNRIFIDIYGLQDELTPEVMDRNVTVYRIIDEPNEDERSMRYVLSKRDAIATFMSYAVGCMMGRYSPYVGGLVLTGQPYGEGFKHDLTFRYEQDGRGVKEPMEGTVIVNAKGESAVAPPGAFLPDRDGILPVTDDEYFQDDIVTKFVRFVEAVYGRETLEENLRFIAGALGTKGDTPREAIRNYYLKEFYRDHLKTYQKRPIYWLFDSGKADGFKALVYLHRYDRDTLARLRTDYVHEQQERLRTQLSIAKKSMEDGDPRRRAAAAKRAQKLQKQVEEVNHYEEILHHMADMRIALDLDDGVVVNYAKMGELVARV